MIRCTVKVINVKGLHTRPAARFASVAGEFECDVRVSNGNHDVSGKSIMGMMVLAASPGTILTLTLMGTDEQQALDRITMALNDDLIVADIEKDTS